MKQNIRLICIHILIPLIIGGFVYLFFRSSTWIHYHIFNYAKVHPIVSLSGTWGNILAFQLPDFCWSYALSSSMFLWKKTNGIRYSYISLLIASIVIGAELIQIFMPAMFTFDSRDLLAAGIAFLLSYHFFNRYEK